ncbi:unnamed protein product [Ectocarpus sp. CCAP 1310/34]|nr:unnamed protein product [Ectocarpus sp. CCAP 1310/34]
MKRVVRLLVLGAGVTNSGLSAAGQTSIPGSATVGGARAMSGMDPSGAASGSSGNRGTKPPAKTNKLAEDGLDRQDCSSTLPMSWFWQLLRVVADARALADQKREEDERRRAAEAKREVGRRQELLDMMAHERAMREDERKHDRQERGVEKAAARTEQKADRRRQELLDMMAHERATREDERKHDRQERGVEKAAARTEQKADRDHQIRMMQLQVDLAKAKG